MTPSLRALAACAVLALPALASGQLAMLRPGAAGPGPATLSAAQEPDGRMRYALGAGATYSSATGANAASFNFGVESAVATTEARWRFGGKALWSRSVGEGGSEGVTLLLTQESQHRWSGRTWLREKFSVLPGLRAGESMRTTLETGLAIAASPFCSINLGVLQRYDGNAAAKNGDPEFVTAINLRLP
ncbi:MAG: hypothetical protein ABIZ18_08020 [Caldimonas sp.]